MTTTSSYLAIQSNLSRYQTMTAAEPMVQGASDYYKANIGKVTTIDQFVGNYRLLSYALQAYGLGDQINSTALIKQVLQQGVTNPKSLANTLSNSAWKTFAKAFDFVDSGSTPPSSSSSVSTTTGDYVEQQLESDQGQNDPGVQLALYFKRVAPTITSGYGILADKNLLEVAQTIFNLPKTASSAQIDAEATEFSKLLPTTDLTNPTKLNSLVERFTANYELDYGPASNNPGGLSVNSGNQSSSVNAASSILSGIVTQNGEALSQYESQSSFSAGLLSTLQGLSLGGA